MKGIESPWGAISLVLISWEQEATLPGTSKSQQEQRRKGAKTMFWDRPRGFQCQKGLCPRL